MERNKINNTNNDNNNNNSNNNSCSENCRQVKRGTFLRAQPVSTVHCSQVFSPQFPQFP